MTDMRNVRKTTFTKKKNNILAPVGIIMDVK